MATGTRISARVLRLAALAMSLCAAWTPCIAEVAGPLDGFRATAKEANSITLKGSCRVCPGASVLLGDVAILEGSVAKGLAGVVVVGAGDVAAVSPLDVPIARVRAALASFDSSLEGRVLVNGSSTRVWVGAAPAISPHEPVQPVVTANAGPTIRDAVMDKVAGVLGVATSALTLSFEAQDAEFLAMSTRGRTVAVSPTGTGERIGVMVKLYERDRVVASQSMRVGVAIRQKCAIAVASLDRAAPVATNSFKIEERNIAPGMIIADPATLVGRTTRSRLAPGEIIEARDVESPVVVSRGDVVTIECLSGAIMLKTYGRARGSGREGDIVSFEPLRKGRPFEARIAGPGRAVAISESGPASLGMSVASEDVVERAPEARPIGSDGPFLALP